MSQLKRPKIGPKSSKKLVSDAEITTAPQCLSVTSSAASAPSTSSEPRPTKIDFIDLTDTDDEVIEVFADQIPNKKHKGESSCTNTAQTSDKTQAIIPPDIEPLPIDCFSPTPLSPFPSSPFRLPRHLPVPLTFSMPLPFIVDVIDLTDTDNEIASLPPLPWSPFPSLIGSPKPTLRIINLLKPCTEDPVSKSGIMLSWNIAKSENLTISKFHVYAYQDGGENSKKMWKKVGDVEALPLPMSWRIEMVLKVGIKCYFAVRAVYQNMMVGEFSLPECLNLNLYKK